jgi:hypothetical protein
LKWEDWKPAFRTADAQCGQGTAKNFPSSNAAGEDGYKPGGYKPDDQVLKDLSDITGGSVTVEELRRLQILSGIEADDHENLWKALGQWCR